MVGRDRGVSSLLARTSTQVRATNVAAAASTLAFGAALASASAHALAMGSALMSTAGAAALLPGMLAAGIGIVVATKAATFGLSDAWKATGVAATGGGGSATAAAKRVAMAQREAKDAAVSLALAQRDLREAQLAVAAAHAEASERLQDLSRELAGARLDEEGATLAVARAQYHLNQVRREPGRTALDEKEAELALRQSKQTLENVKDQVEDLSAEKVDADKKGVEGSDAVQSALRRQEDAQRAVTQAMQRLADAQDALRQSSVGAGGGVNKAAEALAKLSPNGRSLIQTLRALAPAWAGAFRGGQQATLRGVSGDIRSLSGTYLPMATSWLGRMGGAFNVAIRQSMGLAQSKKFVNDVNAVGGNTVLTVDRLGRALRPVVNGIMQFARVGSSFLPGIAGSTLSLAQRFERWAIAARESGKMAGWISGALGVLRQLGAIALNVGGSVGAIFKAGDANAGKGMLDGLVKGTAAMKAWLQSAEGQQKVSSVLKQLRDILTGVAAIIPVVAGQGKAFGDTLSVTGTVVGFVAGHLDTLAKLLPVIAAAYVISKMAQVGANVAMVASIPLRVLEIARSWGMVGALRAHTAALTQNTLSARGAAAATATDTAAQNAGILARGRAVIGMVAHRVATVAISAATKTWAAVQWLLNVALTANPIGIIIMAVVALIVIIVLIATKTTWFQTIWKVVWGGIKAAAHAVGSWFVNTLWKKWLVGAWDGIVGAGVRAFNWMKSLPGRMKAAFLKLAGIITAPFRGAFNAIAGLWNRTVGRLRFTVPSWVPGLGGKGFSLPQLPMLAKGGTVRGAGMAIVGEAGPEVVSLGEGAQVTPLTGRGGGEQVIRIILDGTGVLAGFKREIRARGGNVQVVLGGTGG